MKSAVEKRLDDQQRAAAETQARIQALQELHAGLPRARSEYPLVASVDVEDLTHGGKCAVFRCLAPYEMVRLHLSPDMADELANRLQGKTAYGVQVATGAQAEAILSGLQLDGNGHS
jgi:hypothetical protein